MAVYTAPTFTNNTSPAVNAANLNALAQCAEGNQSLVYQNVSVASTAFVADATYANWPYRASVAITGVTTSYVPTIVFAPDDAASGVFANVAATYNGGVYIYANTIPSGTTTIPSIICVKGATL